MSAALVIQACGGECVGFGWLVGGAVNVRSVLGWMKQGRAWLILALRGAGGVEYIHPGGFRRRGSVLVGVGAMVKYYDMCMWVKCGLIW